MENIRYEYFTDKRDSMKDFLGVNYEAARHFHRSIELLYFFEGSAQASVGDKYFDVQKNDIVFVHNYYVHSFVPKSEYKKYVVIVPANYCNDIDKILSSKTIPHLLSDKEFNKANLFLIFKKLCEEEDEMPPLVKKGYFDVLIGLILSHYDTVPVNIPSNVELVVKILQYIDENYNKKLTLDSVAAEFGYNKYYFSRLFNRYVKDSITNYINVVRLQHFMSLAKKGEPFQISSLALECGFESMPTFYRAFSKMYGESPKAYFAQK